MRAWLAFTIGSVGLVAACTNLDDLAAPDCSYIVSPMAIDAATQGSTGSLAIRAPGVCAWAVESQAGWVSFTGPREGTGDGNVGYAIAAHQGFDYRYATLTVAGKSVSVTQPGNPLPPVCSYSVSPTSTTAPASGGAGSIAVAAPSGCAWGAASQTSWITITTGSSGSGSGAFGFLVTANTASAARMGSMTAGGQAISVTQAGAAPPPNCSYTISPTSANYTQAGGLGTITVTTQAGCAWTATSERSWIRILLGTPGSGNGQVQYAVDPCTCNNDRTGRIVVAGRNFDIRQDGDDGNVLAGVLPVGR